MILTRMFGIIIKAAIPWEALLGFLIELAAKLLRNWMDEQEFSKKAKYFTMAMYVVAEGIGEELADDSKTTVDNKAVEELIRSCESAAEAHGFTLPEVEEL